MTEQNTETALGGSGATGDATPSTSGTTKSTPSSVSPELLAALEGMVDSAVERRTQSLKDKRIAKLEGAQDDFSQRLQRLEELKGKGISQDMALEFMRVEDLISGNRQASEPNKTPEPLPRQAEASVNQIDPGLITKLGLDPADAAVAAALSDLSDGKKVLTTLAQLLDKPKANSAQQLPTQGGSSVVIETRESLTEQLQAEIAKPKKDIVKIRELNQKLFSLQT